MWCFIKGARWVLDLVVLVIAFCWWVFAVDWFGWYMIWLVGCFGGGCLFCFCSSCRRF